VSKQIIRLSIRAHHTHAAPAFAMLMLLLLLLPLLPLPCNTHRACVQGDHQAQHGTCMPASQEYQKALQLRRDVVQALRDSRE
jgi:hypothetical protein